MNEQQAARNPQSSSQAQVRNSDRNAVVVEKIGTSLKPLKPQQDNLLLRTKLLNASLTNKKNLIIVIPSFNDWEALEKLLLLIDEIILEGFNLEVVIVDDYSTNPVPSSLTCQKHCQIQAIYLLSLELSK